MPLRTRLLSVLALSIAASVQLGVPTASAQARSPVLQPSESRFVQQLYQQVIANQRMAEGDDALLAAATAGYTRLRPVLMTAGAMILGMLPMALGIGEGGEQNAPLGRAVIGGLMFATFATLIFVPTMYRLLRRGGTIADLTVTGNASAPA